MPPLFLLDIEFWLRGGGRFSPLITIFCWSEVTFKFWAKSELVEILPNLGGPPLFLPKIEFWLRGVGEIFTSNHNFLLAWGYPESLSQIRVGWIFALFRVTPPPFCLKSSFGWRGGNFFIPNVDSLLGLSSPENLSSMRLMVEAALLTWPQILNFLSLFYPFFRFDLPIFILS